MGWSPRPGAAATLVGFSRTLGSFSNPEHANKLRAYSMFIQCGVAANLTTPCGEVLAATE